jgi:hypothetical protein
MRFSAPIHSAFGTHPSSYMVDAVCFPRIKRPGRGVDTHPSKADVKERVELVYLLPLWAFLACSRVNLSLAVSNSAPAKLSNHGFGRKINNV